MQISDEALKAANDAYCETLTELRLAEGGGFKVASQVRRSIRAALEAAAPYIAAEAWDRCAASIVDEYGNPIIPDSNTSPYRSQA